MTELPYFHVSVVVDPPRGRALVVVGGDVDVATSPQLREQVLAAMGDGVVRVVVDAARVDFIDASGIGVLVDAAGRARQAGIALTLRSPSRAVRRLLDILELLETLPVEDPTEE